VSKDWTCGVKRREVKIDEHAARSGVRSENVKGLFIYPLINR